MEYGASGVPFIAQGLPEYEWFGAGVVVRRPRHWIAALDRLLDPAERRKVADAQYERVGCESIDLRWREWADVYSSAGA